MLWTKRAFKPPRVRLSDGILTSISDGCIIELDITLMIL